MFDNIFQEETVHIDVFDATADVEIRLTEAGRINVELTDRIPVHPDGEFFERMMGEKTMKMYDFHGRTDSDTTIELHDTVVQPTFETGDGTNFYITEISPSEVSFNSTGDDALTNVEVTIEVDVMSFKAPPTFPRQPDKPPLLSRDKFTVFSADLDDADERRDLIKEFRRPLRTGTLTISQQVNGPPERQIEAALTDLADVLWLLSFTQGVFPSPIRARITEINGNRVEDRCEKWVTTFKKDIGHAFKGDQVVFANDTRRFLDKAYDNYVVDKDEYRLNTVISWYLDALVHGRSIQGKTVSICSGIEALAKRYSDLGPGYSETGEKVQHLVDKLGVEVRDLAEFSETYEDGKIDDDSYPNAYFYNKSRQHAVHGDNPKMTFDELFSDYQASLCLLRRVIRNQLVGVENLDGFSQLNDLEVADNRLTK